MNLHSYYSQSAGCYWCPICEKEIPVRSPLPQAKGLVRSNHLRSHGIYTSRLTLEQKKDPKFLVEYWKLLEWQKAQRVSHALMFFTVPKIPMKDPVRCGLCGVIVQGSFKDHIKTAEHQSNLPKFEPAKLPKPPEVPVRVVSEEEKKQNRDKIAKAVNLGYHSVANGRSYCSCRCECGELVDVFAWRGCKRCPNCWKVIHLSLSFKETTT